MDAVTSYNKIDIGIHRKYEDSYFKNENVPQVKLFGDKEPCADLLEKTNSYYNSQKFDVLYWVDKFTRFTILDKSYKIERELSTIKEIILDSKIILDFSNDWDDNGALATNSKTYFRTIDFLLEYTRFVLSNYEHIISPPEINIVRDGSIDLEWRSNKNILLINIKKSNPFNVHFYGEDFSNSTILKGVLTKNELNIDLAHWMKKL